MNRRSSLILAAALAFVAAVGGVCLGHMVIAPPRPVESQMHQLLHEQLNLDAAQSARVEGLEKDFALRKAALEAQLRAANVDLAAAIEAEHGYGPRVASAVDKSHHAMGELQKATLEHVFAMRSVLRPDQANRFDAAIVKALTGPAK
ncbi:periplasmic heavy metal sensor [Novosphingobium rosa]|uniref:periplasmic heavy metal sensor n=1 Tax=Novosphingobium rosa TaxID=76978 RepID=UPI000832A19C|nr:periplasmic heavy metal sensor [Novosphingobium rosa]